MLRGDVSDYAGREGTLIPTPDPTLLASAVTTLSAIFTGNYATILTAVVALVGIITVPIIVIRGGLAWAVGGIRRLFRRA